MVDFSNGINNFDGELKRATNKLNDEMKKIEKQNDSFTMDDAHIIVAVPDAIAELSSHASVLNKKESDFAKELQDKFSSIEDMKVLIETAEVFKNALDMMESLDDKNKTEFKRMFLHDMSILPVEKLKDVLHKRAKGYAIHYNEYDGLSDYIQHNIRKNHVFSISEVVDNDKINVNEAVALDEEDDKDEVDEEYKLHNMLWYVLDNVNVETTDVEVEDDTTESAEEREFNGKTVLIGDNSKLKFAGESKNEANVSVADKKNTLDISHSKKSVVPVDAMASSFKGVVDFMEAKDEIPFDFTLTTQTPQFKQDFISSIIDVLHKDEIANKVTANAMVAGVAKDSKINGRISAFVIDGVTIPYNDFITFNSYDDFTKFEEKMNKSSNGNDDAKMTQIDPRLIHGNLR